MRRFEEASACELSVETIRAVLREHPVRLGLLFGSHARGEAAPGSDVDVAVAFENCSPSDPAYNDAFLGLSAELSTALETDAVDLLDLETTDPGVVESVFDDGVLIVGELEDAAALRAELTGNDRTRSPKERFDAALSRVDAHLGDVAPAGGNDPRDDG